jgi:hypothetical protein
MKPSWVSCDTFFFFSVRVSIFLYFDIFIFDIFTFDVFTFRHFYLSTFLLSIKVGWIILFITLLSSCMHECTTYYICWYSYLSKISKLKKCLFTNDHRQKYFPHNSFFLSSFLQSQRYVWIKLQRYFFTYWMLPFSYSIQYLMLWKFQKILEINKLKFI